jgi:hypothetical protein
MQCNDLCDALYIHKTTMYMSLNLKIKMLIFLVSRWNHFTLMQLSFKFFCWATRLWFILGVIELFVSHVVVITWSHRFNSMGHGFLNKAVQSLNQMNLLSNTHVRAHFILIVA